MKKLGKSNLCLVFYLTAFLVVALDQTVKFFAKKIELGKSIFDTGFFSFTHVNNYGAGFSILQGKVWLFIAIALAFIAVVISFYKKIGKNVFEQAGFSLMLGGTLSNVIDRLVYGYVIDFLDFKIWPVFNIADSAISIGVILIIIYYLKKK
jgi:signal peptidase II